MVTAERSGSVEYIFIHHRFAPEHVLLLIVVRLVFGCCAEAELELLVTGHAVAGVQQGR